MKKFKIGNKVVYANSLHDALEIYKHKVKDKNNVYEMQYTNTAKKYTNIDKFRAPSLAEAMTRINLIAYVEDSRRRDILVKSIKENGIDLNISGRGDALLKKYNPSAWSTGTLGHHYDDSIGDSKVKDFNAILDPFLIKKLQRAIDAIKSSDYKEAKSLVDDIANNLKYRV